MFKIIHYQPRTVTRSFQSCIQYNTHTWCTSALIRLLALNATHTCRREREKVTWWETRSFSHINGKAYCRCNRISIVLPILVKIPAVSLVTLWHTKRIVARIFENRNGRFEVNFRERNENKQLYSWLVLWGEWLNLLWFSLYSTWSNSHYALLIGRTFKSL